MAMEGVLVVCGSSMVADTTVYLGKGPVLSSEIRVKMESRKGALLRKLGICRTKGGEVSDCNQSCRLSYENPALTACRNTGFFVGLVSNGAA
jgi:hypothetical protein